ncbi:DUF2218 domain-containing protein [Pacificoceanicola onchidii]|uniref:DUF2218 domain-containing protein n=1 Tax=Pacificoceanicola onchidii TaxID=2562685 RepID=UPI0010A33D8B|nr:DUF2218 domain-containing protein [Pacificoceanicola onchidii]
MRAFAIFQTDQANRHLTTLCHHFGRKVEARCDAGRAQIVFAFGQCDLAATDQQLELSAQAEDKARLDVVVDVVTRHLERFAFRENPQLDWHPAE